jgi:hypothetical protein
VGGLEADLAAVKPSTPGSSVPYAEGFHLFLFLKWS